MHRRTIPLFTLPVATTSPLSHLLTGDIGTDAASSATKYPIFSVIGPGKNGSSTLFWSIHSDRRDLPRITLHESEEQHFNKFHLHFLNSLSRVLATFPDHAHRIVYPVRRDIARQIVSSFIQYAKKIETREDRLGLPPGHWSDWSMADVISAFDRFVECRQFPQVIGNFHRDLMAMYEFEVKSLTSVQSFERSGTMLAVVLTEAINDVVPALKTFCAPSKFTLKQSNQTSEDLKNIFSGLVPHAQTRLAKPLRDLRAEFPAFYDASSTGA